MPDPATFIEDEASVPDTFISDTEPKPVQVVGKPQVNQPGDYIGQFSGGAFSAYQPENMQEAVDLLTTPALRLTRAQGTNLASKLTAAPINVAEGLIESATSPFGAATLGLAGTPVGRAALAAGYGIPAIREGLSGLEEAGKTHDVQKGTEATIQALLGAGMLALPGTVKEKGLSDAIKERIKQSNDLIQHPRTEEVGLRPETGGGDRPVGEPTPQEKVTTPVTEPPTFEETTPVTPEVVASTFTNPQTGETTTAPSHVEAAAEQGVEAPKQPEARETPAFGYQVQDPVTGEKATVSREEGGEVAKKADQLKKEPEDPNAVRSNEIEMAKPGAPAKPKGRRFVIGPRPDGRTDILDAVQELGGLKPPGKDSGGEYDAWKESMTGSARLLINRKAKHGPDTILDDLKESGFGRIDTPDKLFNAIQRAVKEREALRTKGGSEEMKWANFWKAAQYPDSKSGLQKINIDDLRVGQTFRLRFPGASNQELEVVAIDADSHAVTVKDGPTFGVQDLPEGTEIFVQKGTLSETPKPTTGGEFGFSADVFNLAGESEKSTEPTIPNVAPVGQQQEMFNIQQVTENKDPVKSADAAEKIYGSPQDAISKLNNQIRVIDSDPKTKALFSKEQRERLKEVISLLNQRAITPMGFAMPKEFEQSPQTPTGIKNSTVDVERAKRGLPPAIQPLRRSFGEVWDRSMALVDRDPGYQDNLIASLEKKPRALTDEEDALILQRQVDLQNEYGKATRDLAQAFEDGRTDAVEAERIRVAGLSDQLLRLYNLGKKVGTETGRGLNARKMMAYEDFTLAKMDLDMRSAKGGRPLTAQETQQIAELHQKILDTQKAYDDYRAASETRIALAETQRIIAEGKASQAPRFDKRILAQAESIVKRMEDAAKPAADRLKDRLSRLSAGVDPTIVYDAAIVGSAKIARLGLDLAKFTDEMVREFGEKLRPMINDIWTEANKMVDAATIKVPQARKAIKSLATVAEFKEGTTQSIKEKVAAGQKDKITWYVQQLARKLVESGVTDREALINEVHAVLQDAIPGITRREAMDAISGYGDYKQLSKDAITVQLRGMKGEMQQIAKLEDMAKGDPPLKSGVERRTPTEAERQLIKLVNDAKYKFQVPVEDPQTQLKSALDTLKTTLKNRITDYEDRIKRGDYAARPRRAIELDAEASRLKAENERVKKQFQRGVQLERLKNLSNVERGANWITKWRRGFILSGWTTLAKLTAAAVQRMAITPVEEAVGGAIGRIIPSVAERAPREGTFNSTAEAKALTDGVVKGMKDAWDTLRTGQSDLDVLHGKEALLPPSAIDFFGHVHGALKAPAKRAEFARSLEKRTAFEIAHGVDVSDPLVQSKLVIEAYKDANKSIFLQDNRVVSAYKRALSALEQKDKSTGKPTLAGKAAATAARVLFPIVKVPTNIVAETLQYATGSVTGSIRLGAAFAKGIENLQPEQADLIMRELKKGSIGAAVMLVGYFNPQVIGGYYQPGEKRKKGEAGFGALKVYGVNIPSFLLHNPLLETMQIGATVRRVADSKLNKKDTDTQGIGAGIYAAAIGIASEVPFVREMWETSKAFNQHEKGAFWGELGKSMIVPQALQEWAKYEDKNQLGQTVKRAPKTALQHIETGIPGLREEVPKAKNQPVGP